jgi:hypothetical protein
MDGSNVLAHQEGTAACNRRESTLTADSKILADRPGGGD